MQSAGADREGKVGELRLEQAGTAVHGERREAGGTRGVARGAGGGAGETAARAGERVDCE